MNARPSTDFKGIITGLLFAVLWGSAATATKIGLLSAQPFVIAITRFGIASVIMLILAHGVFRKRLPTGEEWKGLIIYGLLNVAVYLGLYVVALQYVSAGIAALFVAVNPVLISLIGVIWLSQPLGKDILFSFLFCMAGLVIASLPLLAESHATPFGLVTLFISMLSYSVGAVYYAKREWKGLHILAINGWQTFFGGITLIPATIFFFDTSLNRYDLNFWSATLWLSVPVSIGAVLLWLHLLRDNTVKASFWLFLCPVLGYAIAAITLGDPVTWHTYLGIFFVLTGLYIVQYRKRKDIS